MRQADQLQEVCPELDCTVQLRLMAVGRAMEQLKIKHENEDINSRFLGNFSFHYIFLKFSKLVEGKICFTALCRLCSYYRR